MDFSTLVATPSWLEVEARTSDQATWITLRGEADVSNHQQLEAALSAVEVDGADRVYLQLSELGFCDVGTLCRLLNFAQEVSANHCDVVAVEANPLVQLMTRLLAVDEELRFEPLPVGSEG
jgi:anti-anti-sigma factor